MMRHLLPAACAIGLALSGGRVQLCDDVSGVDGALQAAFNQQ